MQKSNAFFGTGIIHYLAGSKVIFRPIFFFFKNGRKKIQVIKGGRNLRTQLKAQAIKIYEESIIF